MSINIAISGKNIQVTKSLKTYINKEIEGLEKYFEKIISAHIVLNVEKEREIVEVNLQTAGSTIHVSESTDDLYKSIDACIDHLERKLKQFKQKMIDRKRQFDKTQFSFENKQEVREGVETDEGHHIVLVDRYVKKPMNVEEAAMQLEITNNDFLVFFNDAADKINVIYRRKDGDFGLINPEF